MSPVHTARTKLACPLYAADFDSVDSNYLVVGGGGGYGSSGVPNKISLLDTSRRDEIKEIVGIDLPKDGDSTWSIAVAASSDTSLTAYAGVNGPIAAQKAGSREHLRVFEIELPPRQVAGELSEKSPAVSGRSKSLASLTLFQTPADGTNETYQRLTRFSPLLKTTERRYAAIATALAPHNEVVVLDSSSPSVPEIVKHIPMGKTEATDLDFGLARSNDFIDSLAFCTDHRVWLQLLENSSQAKNPPIKVYESPEFAAGVQVPAPSKLRCLRFLTRDHLLLLQNRPARTGAELLVLKLQSDDERGTVILQKRLNTAMKSAVGMDVCALSGNEAGDKQVVIAVAGQNSSVEVLTMECTSKYGPRRFKTFEILKDIHSGPITRVCFSNFVSPTLPVTKETRAQYTKLATVGVDQKVVLHTFPLQPFPAQHDDKPRYVLVSPAAADSLQTTFSVFMAIVVIGIAAFLMQAFSEIRGAVPPILGATEWLNPRVSGMIARPYIFASPSDIASVTSEVASSVSTAFEEVEAVISDLPPVEAVPGKLAELLQQQSDGIVLRVIVMRDSASDLVAELHHESDAFQAATVKKWGELTEAEKKGWKQRLNDAGHWSANQGENVLQGIFFSELAGMVG